MLNAGLLLPRRSVVALAGSILTPPVYSGDIWEAGANEPDLLTGWDERLSSNYKKHGT